MNRTATLNNPTIGQRQQAGVRTGPSLLQSLLLAFVPSAAEPLQLPRHTSARALRLMRAGD